MTVAADEDAPRADERGLVAPGDTWWMLAVFGGAGFVVLAIALEVLAGSYANSPTPGWGHWIPLAWPTAARVVWWLLVAAAAGAFRFGLGRLGFRQRPLTVVLTIGPFVGFALGIAAGAEWAAWH